MILSQTLKKVTRFYIILVTSDSLFEHNVWLSAQTLDLWWLCLKLWRRSLDFILFLWLPVPCLNGKSCADFLALIALSQTLKKVAAFYIILVTSGSLYVKKVRLSAHTIPTFCSTLYLWWLFLKLWGRGWILYYPCDCWFLVWTERPTKKTKYVAYHILPRAKIYSPIYLVYPI